MRTKSTSDRRFLLDINGSKKEIDINNKESFQKVLKLIELNFDDSKRALFTDVCLKGC